RPGSVRGDQRRFCASDLAAIDATGGRRDKRLAPFPKAPERCQSRVSRRKGAGDPGCYFCRLRAVVLSWHHRRTGAQTAYPGAVRGFWTGREKLNPRQASDRCASAAVTPPSDRHPVTVEFMILIVSALACAQICEVMNEFNCRDPLHHLEPELVFTAQPQWCTVQDTDGRTVHLISKDS